MSRRPKQSQPSADFDTEASLRANAIKLQAALDSIELHGDGEHSSTIQELARISVALTGVCAELRQHSKAAQRQLDSFPIAALVERLKGLPDEDRDRIRRELGGEKDEESLL